jgi:hypothetical protein
MRSVGSFGSQFVDVQIAAVRAGVKFDAAVGRIKIVDENETHAGIAAPVD